MVMHIWMQPRRESTEGARVGTTGARAMDSPAATNDISQDQFNIVEHMSY